jgi:hypothetical protein
VPGEKGRYFVKTDKSDCKTYPATISWEWCNRNDQNLVYITKKAAIHYDEKYPRDNNSMSLFDFKAEKTLAANRCDNFSFDVNLDSCRRGGGVQWFDIILKGKINNGQDKCHCYEFNQEFSLIADGLLRDKITWKTVFSKITKSLYNMKLGYFSSSSSRSNSPSKSSMQWLPLLSLMLSLRQGER